MRKAKEDAAAEVEETTTAAETLEEPPADEPEESELEAAADAREAAIQARVRDKTRLKRLQDEMASLREENENFRREKEEARKAALSQAEREREEYDEMKSELERTRRELLEKEVRTKYRIPDDLVLLGSDREALETHAQLLQKYVPKQKAGSITQPGQEGGPAPRFTRAQIAAMTLAEYEANKPAIDQARREERIS